MTQGATPPILRYLRSLTAKEKLKNMPDGELLKLFTAEHDETAFAVMVRRHGGMVLAVCRSLLQNHADADDAFQATFLVLARQARSIRKKGSLGSWLYGVAYRTALKAKAARARRRHHEAQVRTEAQPDAVDELTWREAQWILHHELARLPEKYRAPLVLCYLEGKRQDEAERVLGWRPGKLRSMLERARERLRTYLVRRGFGPSAVLFAAVGFGNALAAAPQGELLASTVRAAASLAMGPAAAAGVVSARVLSLTEAVIQTMTMGKVKLFACGLLMVAVLGFGVKELDRSVCAEEPTASATVAPVSTVARSAKNAAKAEEMLNAEKIGVRGSSSWGHHTPDRAFDGDPTTMWNAGDYAPQWLEADLRASTQLASIRLRMTQLPAGETTHQVWVSDEPIGGNRSMQPVYAFPGPPRDSQEPDFDIPKEWFPRYSDEQIGGNLAKAKLAHTFTGHTRDNQELKFDFPKGLSARYVQIRTTQSPSWVAWVEVELRVRRNR